MVNTTAFRLATIIGVVHQKERGNQTTLSSVAKESYTLFCPYLVFFDKKIIPSVVCSLPKRSYPIFYPYLVFIRKKILPPTLCSVEKDPSS